MGGKQSTVQSQLSLLKREFADERFHGLDNYGNTCYCNSVIQALYACRGFRARCLEYYEKNKKQEESASLLMCLSALFHRIATSKKRCGVLGPAKFVKKMKKENQQFDGHMHQDAQEFMNFLLNDISDTLRKETAADMAKESKLKKNKKQQQQQVQQPSSSSEGSTTWVQDIFEGTLQNETKCLMCETCSSRDEKFIDLSLDIEDNASLTHCLRQFSAKEILTGNDKYLCDQCNTHQEAYKCMKIKRLPNVFVLHLKRFKFIERLEAYKKLFFRVVFPAELKLVNTAREVEDEDRVYNLIAVVVHIGSGTKHGHYVCMVKKSTRWFLYDDDSIQIINESDVKSCFGSLNSQAHQDGYLLFYDSEQSSPTI